MEKTTNAEQEIYMFAKANLEVLKGEADEEEQKYIATHGIVNPDGSIPKYLYCIEDENTFIEAEKNYEAIIKESGLEQKINAAVAVLKVAEDRMIEYGLSIVPANLRNTLKEASKNDLAIRHKLIDLVLKLDVSTVEQRKEIAK